MTFFFTLRNNSPFWHKIISDSPWGSRCRSLCSGCQARVCRGCRSQTWGAPWCRASRWSRIRPPALRAWPGDPCRVCAGDQVTTGHNIRRASCVVSGVSPHHRRISEKLILSPLCQGCSPPGCHSPAGVLCCTVPRAACTVLCHLPRLAWPTAAPTTAEKIATELWRYLLLCYRQKISLVYIVDIYKSALFPYFFDR